MCSIMGYCSRSAVLSRFMEGFQKTISRGPRWDLRIPPPGYHGTDPIGNAALSAWKKLCGLQWRDLWI